MKTTRKDSHTSSGRSSLRSRKSYISDRTTTDSSHETSSISSLQNSSVGSSTSFFSSKKNEEQTFKNFKKTILGKRDLRSASLVKLPQFASDTKNQLKRSVLIFTEKFFQKPDPDVQLYKKSSLEKELIGIIDKVISSIESQEKGDFKAALRDNKKIIDQIRRSKNKSILLSSLFDSNNFVFDPLSHSIMTGDKASIDVFMSYILTEKSARFAVGLQNSKKDPTNLFAENACLAAIFVQNLEVLEKLMPRHPDGSFLYTTNIRKALLSIEDEQFIFHITGGVEAAIQLAQDEVHSDLSLEEKNEKK